MYRWNLAFVCLLLLCACVYLNKMPFHWNLACGARAGHSVTYPGGALKTFLMCHRLAFPIHWAVPSAAVIKLLTLQHLPRGFCWSHRPLWRRQAKVFILVLPKRQSLWRCEATQEWGHLEAGLQSQVVLSFPCTGGGPLAGCDQWHPIKSCLIRSWPRNGGKESGWQWGYSFEFGFINQIT